MKKIVLASGNTGKIAEINVLLKHMPIQLIPQSDFHIESVEETGTTFIENAIIKARHATHVSKLPAIADDSGLAVHALQGAPGVYSARYGGQVASDLDRIRKVLTELEKINTKDRSATFYCVMVLLRHEHDPAPTIFQGKWDGVISREPKGHQGFGYDPIFYVPTHHCSASELDRHEKNNISHRGQAVRQLIDALKNR